MTTPDIQSLVESVLRLDKEATAGPWRAGKIASVVGRVIYRDDGPGKNYKRICRNVASKADSDFIIHSRAGIATLSREVMRLRVALNEILRNNCTVITEEIASEAIGNDASFTADADLTRLRAELEIAKADIADRIERDARNLESLKKRIRRTNELEAELAEEKRKVEVAMGNFNIIGHACGMNIESGDRLRLIQATVSDAIAALTTPSERKGDGE